MNDVARLQARFVNRALGTGTRVLLDELLTEAGLAPQALSGYDRCEPSHSAVALAVLGPLTNLALALRKEPALAKRLGPVAVMGGARAEGGNITASAEFNIWADPDAAAEVLASDVTALPVQHWQWSAWLSAKGRTLAVFQLLRLADDHVLLVLADGDADAIASQLQRFVFRRKVKIEVRTELAVAGSFSAAAISRVWRRSRSASWRLVRAW